MERIDITLYLENLSDLSETITIINISQYQVLH